jgi:hypothetical protein
MQQQRQRDAWVHNAMRAEVGVQGVALPAGQDVKVAWDGVALGMHLGGGREGRVLVPLDDGAAVHEFNVQEGVTCMLHVTRERDAVVTFIRPADHPCRSAIPAYRAWLVGTTVAGGAVPAFPHPLRMPPDLQGTPLHLTNTFPYPMTLHVTDGLGVAGGGVTLMPGQTQRQALLSPVVRVLVTWRGRMHAGPAVATFTGRAVSATAALPHAPEVLHSVDVDGNGDTRIVIHPTPQYAANYAEAAQPALCEPPAAAARGM